MKMRRLLAGLLALAMALPLTACGGKGEEGGTPAMGRYVEETRTLPEGTEQVLALRADAQGELDLLCYIPNAEEPERWLDLGLFHSADGGVTWTAQDSTALNTSAMEDYMLETACWDSRGELWFFGYDTSEEPPEGEYYTARFFRMAAEGQEVTDLDFNMDQIEGAGPRSFKVADNGDLLVDCWWVLYHLDGETGAVKNQFEVEDGSVEGYDIRGNEAVYCANDALVFYDMEAARETGRVAAASFVHSSNDNSTWNRLAAYTPDGSVCYADAKGIYRTQTGNSMLEQVVDGGLTSLGTPSFLMQFFVPLDDSFLMVSWVNEAWSLTAYVYDPGVPTLPGQELRVWSMEEDPLVRQAIGTFQKDHPEVYVTYELGYTEGEGSYSWDDALKTIATELVAGKGPDVLVLDGMPLDSYAEKGVLLDLSEDFAALEDRLLPHKAAACRRADGTLPGIPLQFDAPVLHASTAAVSASRDLESMVDWLEANRDSFNHPLSVTEIDWIMQVFTLTDRDRLYAGDEAAWTAFLTQMKRIWDMEQGRVVEDSWGLHPEFGFGALAWSIDAVGIDLGYLCSFDSLYAAWQASQNRGDGETVPLFGHGLYQPKTILGINARSQNTAVARQFLATALSEEVQGSGVGTGMPVNAAAFDASTQEDPDPNRNGHFSTYGTTLTDKDGADVPIYVTIDYPPEDYRSAWAETLKALDTPVLLDGSIQTIMEQETADYFAGKQDLDGAVDRVIGKLELYLAE